MNQHSTNDELLVQAVFEALLSRIPQPAELRYGVNAVAGRSDGFRRYLTELLATPEAAAVVERRSREAHAPLFVYPGHYYSPICDVEQLKNEKFLEAIAGRNVSGIDLRMAEQEQIFLRLANEFSRINFPEHATGENRYFFENDFYNIGDATILAAFIRCFKPRRVVEVGSGFSSAVILDTLDAMYEETGSSERTECTFVEPYPDRLRALLKESDLASSKILEAGVQFVDQSVFKALRRDDILFLDTTHISRTGSDVNHEVFEILPHLSPGVIVHFHDFFHNFEYPKDWIIDQNRSWNEIYLIRAFLMYNSEYEIMYFNHHFAIERTELVANYHPGIAAKPGGGLWLRRL